MAIGEHIQARQEGTVIAMKTHFEEMAQRESQYTKMTEKDLGPMLWLDIFREKQLQQVEEEQPITTTPDEYWLDVYRQKQQINRVHEQVIERIHSPVRDQTKTRKNATDKQSRQQLELRLIQLIRRYNTLSDYLESASQYQNQQQNESEAIPELMALPARKLKNRSRQSRRMTIYPKRSS